MYNFKNPKKLYLFSTGKRKILITYFETAIHTTRNYFHVHCMFFHNLEVMESYDGKKYRLEKDEPTINYFCVLDENETNIIISPLV